MSPLIALGTGKVHKYTDNNVHQTFTELDDLQIADI